MVAGAHAPVGLVFLDRHRLVVGGAVGHKAGGHLPPARDGQADGKITHVAVGVEQALVARAQRVELYVEAHVEHEALLLDAAVGGRIEGVDVVVARPRVHGAAHAGRHRHVVRHIRGANAELRVGQVKAVLRRGDAHAGHKACQQ